MNDSAPLNKLRKIEGELRRLGALRGEIQPPVIVNSPFGMGEMPFEDWLAKVFLPRAYAAAAANAWPRQSQVGTVAIRNFDGQDEYGPLVDLLCEFDQAVVAYGQSEGGTAGTS